MSDILEAGPWPSPAHDVAICVSDASAWSTIPRSVGAAIDALRAGGLGDLPDVDISSPADNELLAYDSGCAKWTNQTPGEAGLIAADGSVQLTADWDAGAHKIKAQYLEAFWWVTSAELAYNGSMYISASGTARTLYIRNTTGGENLDVRIDGSLTAGTGAGFIAVDNLKLDGNTVSSTDTNGDISLTPDGTGQVVVGKTGDIVLGTSGTAITAYPDGDEDVDLGKSDKRFGRGWFAGGLNVKASHYNIAGAAPTDAELDAAFGQPGTLAPNAGDAWVGVLDDNGGGTDLFLCVAHNSVWTYAALTVAT